MKMKLEQLLAKCPKCGSTDKTAKRRFLDEHKAHAELDSIVCDNCGHIFEES
jgi:Cys-rich peptide (TIGR04165 family)